MPRSAPRARGRHRRPRGIVPADDDPGHDEPCHESEGAGAEREGTRDAGGSGVPRWCGRPVPAPRGRGRDRRAARRGAQPVGHGALVVTAGPQAQRLRAGGREEQAGELVGARTLLRARVHRRLEGCDDPLRSRTRSAHLRERRSQPGRTRHLARETEPAERTERVDVGGGRGDGPEQHLRGEVAGRAPDGGRRLPQHPSEAEVSEGRAPVEVEQDVAGRHVAVDHPGRVQPAEGLGQRGEHGDDLPGPEVPPGADEVGQRTPAHQGHDQRHAVVGQGQARLDPHDVLGGRPARHRGLAHRGLGGLGVGVRHLERHAAPVAQAHRLPDVGRPSAAEQPPDPEAGHHRRLRRLHDRHPARMRAYRREVFHRPS